MATVWLPKLRLVGENFAAAPRTTWLKTGETLDAKWASPLYVAVMVWVLGPRVENCSDATPLLFSDDIPRFVAVAVSKKFTVPVGLPWLKPGGAVTAAVRVTACPKLDGLTEDSRATVTAGDWRRMLIVLSAEFVTAKSSSPSPLKSPTATACGDCPTFTLMGAWNVPLPFPKYRSKLVLGPAAAISSLLSPFKSTATPGTGPRI